MSQPHGHGDRNPEIRFEASDVRAAAILKFALWLALSTVLVLFLMRLMYVGFAKFEAAQQPLPPIMQTDANRQPPLPRLQELPAVDLFEYRREDDRVLRSYGWVDPTRGIVRIPIEEAMRLTLQRGLPVRGKQ